MTRNDIHSNLKMRKEQLLALKAQAETSLKHAPEGFLRIHHQKQRLEYYHRTNPKDFSGSYIPHSNFELVQQLAQKDYLTKISFTADAELKAIEKYFSALPPNQVEDIYKLMSPERQSLITPLWESDADFVKNWTSIKYQGKYFDEHLPALFTSKGERVRSKSEIIIADALARESIPYRYEFPLHLPKIGTIYPDFTVLNVRERKEIYWEHLGLMDDPEYVEKAIKKIISYEQNGIFQGEQLILTYETKLQPINQNLVQHLIHHHLK